MRILFVAMVNSVHTARWIDQLAGQGWDIHVFSVVELAPCPELRNVTVHNLIRHPNAGGVRQTGLIYNPFKRGSNRLVRGAELLTRGRTEHTARLASLMRSLRPDMVHTLEMQSAGYLMLQAASRLERKQIPPWIYSSWGSDIYYYGRQPAHVARVKGVLKSCDYYIPDCSRDTTLARQYGFGGEILGTFPAGGGFPIDDMQKLRAPGPPSARRRITLKGYDHWVYRGVVAVEAVRQCADLLKDYEILVYSPGNSVRAAARAAAAETGVRFTLLNQIPHEEMLGMMGNARASIALSTSDGTPNAMLESMIMGALPIQSDTGSTGEWISDGVNGELVPAEDPDAVAAAIRRVLTDDAYVDQAAIKNSALTRIRVDASIMRPKVLELYRHVYNRSKGLHSQTASHEASAS
ncbi:MAG TPA: glycosyltransferase family 4 protein [Tepidisphaeraceae bacterium]|nr:glycosyltransferase family 4 protein [Tepidisphaeraceae bacterium]